MSSFERASASEGETLAAVAQRLGVSFSRGAGYYSLNKSEKVSATKDLVLEKADSWIVGAASVRAALGLGAGDVTIKPTDVAPEHQI